MNKEDFVSFMNRFMGKREEVEEFYQDLDQCFGGIDRVIENSYMMEVIDLLVLVLDDKNGWLDWFLFEQDGKFGGKYWCDGQECVLSSYGELYDIIKA